MHLRFAVTLEIRSKKQTMPQFQPDIGHIPSHPDVIQDILNLAKITPEDIFYDLGCGDGQMAIAAALQYGARGVGIDIDPDRIQAANENALAAGVSDRVTFRHQNIFESDFSDATVVYVYLLPHVNKRLRPMLWNQLKPGTRVLSLDFDMEDWQPEQVIYVPTPEAEFTIFRWGISGREIEVK
jgi:ribosomal protein L11 methylase PrmA